MILMLIFLSSCSFTTANFSNIAMSSDINSDFTPVNETTKFSTNTPIFYVSGRVNNAPASTQINGKWYYIDTEPAIFIDESVYLVENTTTSFYFSLSAPDNGWPSGTYSVELYIDGKIEQTLTFTVE